MPLQAMREANAYRFFDYPRPGSIYRMLDNPRLVRGPTYVKLPSGKDIPVPSQLKSEHVAPAEIHENRKSNAGLEDLLKLLKGQKQDGPAAGFRTGGRFDRPVQTPLLHPRELPRRAPLGEHVLHF